MRRIFVVSCLVFLSQLLNAEEVKIDQPERKSIETESDRFSGKTVKTQYDAVQLVSQRLQHAPMTGEIAPGFDLYSLDRKEKVSLAELHTEKPVVLVMASWGCGIFRESFGGVVQLYYRFSDRINFVFLYVREAHGLGGFDPKLARVKDPATTVERIAVALKFKKQMRVPFDILVDPIEDPVATNWGAWPVRLFAVDTKGTVIYAGKQGPWGYQPYEGFNHGDGASVGYDSDFSSESLEVFLDNYLKN